MRQKRNSTDFTSGQRMRVFPESTRFPAGREYSDFMPDELPPPTTPQKPGAGLPNVAPDVMEAELGEQIDNIVPSYGYQMTPMVGIGGSAGAFRGLQAFFESTPSDSGMVFVVILHLSPDHASSMAEMIQKWTQMKVRQVSDGEKAEPNTVYVIPPAKHLTATNGHFRLTELDREHGRRVAVDLFFRSLADTHGPHAAAIILSGADSDGSIGIKRIKERGGLTVAQDPEEAEQGGMPQAAIGTGMVDWVLRTREMPGRLLDYYSRKTQLRLPPEEGPQPAQAPPLSKDERESALREVLSYLRTRTGRDFSYYKRATIVRRVSRRMQVNAVNDLPAYLSVLRTNPGEAGALLQDLLISVTNFFRDREAFDALSLLIPRLFHGKSTGDTVRVWVPACASGEEAYSLAMLLAERASTLESSPTVQIFGCDLDDSAIHVARAGLYPESIQADVSEERLRRFFNKETRGYRIRRELREMVLFAAHDLLKDAPFARMDLVSCRNLLIYLNRDAQRRAYDIFHFSLKPSGLLFLGSSETVDEQSPLFMVVDKKYRVYGRRQAVRVGIPVPSGPGTLVRAIEQANRTGPVLPGRTFTQMPGAGAGVILGRPNDAITPAELHFRLIEQFGPPSVIVNSEQEIVHLSQNAGKFLQWAGGQPTANLLRIVHPTLRADLRSALFHAAESDSPVELRKLRFEIEGVSRAVNIKVSPARELAPGFLLVVFEPAEVESEAAAEKRSAPEPAVGQLERELEQIKMRLRDTVEQYEASTEELKASNEELQAMNEELRSASEELETSREELQSMNEEISTVNQELKNKLDELSHANSDLHNLMASTAIPTIFLDRQLRIMRFTPTAVDLFRLIPSDIGRPLGDLHHRLDYPDLSADALRVLDNLVPVQREVRAGNEWFLARLLPYRTLDDHIGGVVLAFVNITEGKQATESLRTSEEQFRRAIEEAPIPVIMHAEDGQLLQISSTWTELTGYTRADIPTFDDWLNKAHGSGAEKLRRHIQQLFSGRARRMNEEIEIKSKSGGIRSWAVSASAPGRLVDGRRFIVAMALDITDRRKAEEALRSSQEELRLIVDNATEYAIFSMNLERRITTWNAGARLIFGYAAGEAIGQSADLIFTEEDRARGAPVEEARTALEQGRANDDRWHVRKDGGRFWSSGAMMPMRNSQGAAIGLIKVLRDQTAELRDKETVERSRKELEEALVQAEKLRREADAANKAKDHFLATLSHELRTPLMPVLVTSESLLKSRDLPARVRDGLQMISRNVQLETHFINDLLDLTRVSKGKFDLLQEPVDLHGAIQGALEICDPEFKARNQKLSVRLEAKKTEMVGDSARLQQVFWNLLKNASKFTPQNGNVQISSQNEGNNIVVKIQDSGIGIDPTQLKHIFEAFHQGDASVSRQYGGLGLGLAISRATIEQLAGSIEAASDGPGHGSVFTVKLPLPAPVQK
jgi:two-component system CheB/CheR fusion protein